MAEWKKVLVSGSAAEVTSLKASSVVNAGGDTDKFLVLDSSGNVDFRTGTEVRSDIGAGAGSGDISRVNITAGTGLSGTTDTTSGDHTQTINLGVAAASTLGGIKVGTNLSINGSGVLSSTDTNTTYSVGDGGLTQKNFTTTLKTKLDAIEAGARADQTAAEIRSLVGSGNGNFVPAAGASGTFLKGDGTFGTPSYTTNTNTTYSVQDGELSQNNFTNADHTKLNGIATGANVYSNSNAVSAVQAVNLDMGSNNITTTGKMLFANMYAAEGDLPSASTYHGMFAHVHGTGAGYFAHGGNWIKLANNSQLPSVGDGGLTTNDFTNADHSKLNAIEASATADQSAAELRSAIGTGNGNLVPSAGGSGTFLKGDGTFGTPSYVANTDVDVSIANLKTRLGGGFAGNAVTIGDSSDVVTIGKDLVVTGNLQINGTQTTVNTANLAVEDQFIELNDGGSARDAGIVVNLATNGSVATAFGYDQSEGRWAFDLTGATADQTAIASDAYAVTVHKTDSRALAGAISGYAKDGNVLINSDGEIYMYVA